MQAKKEQIDEISAMSAGAVEGPAVKEEELEENEELEEDSSEDRVRLVVREAIKMYYAQKNKMLSTQDIFEEKIRQFIRSKLLAEKQSNDAPPASTLEGIMRTLLNNIIPQLRIQYTQLQSNDEERQGFKDYFYNAVDGISDLTRDQREAEESGQQDLEEEKVVIKSDDPDFISGVEDGEEKAEEENKESEGADRDDISSFFQRGQNFGLKAFEAIKDRIEDVVASQIVPDEYPEFEKVLNANLQAWFKIWDQNRTQEDESQLDIPEEPAEPINTGGENELLDQAEETGELGGTEDLPEVEPEI